MPGGVGEVQDFMPPARGGKAAHRQRVIRRVVAVRGQMRFVVDAAPRFDYGRGSHEVALTPAWRALPLSRAEAEPPRRAARSRSSTAATFARASSCGAGRWRPSCSTAWSLTKVPAPYSEEMTETPPSSTRR